eukprot:1847386-Rhodomonas_salina.1
MHRNQRDFVPCWNMAGTIETEVFPLREHDACQCLHDEGAQRHIVAKPWDPMCVHLDMRPIKLRRHATERVLSLTDQ